VGTELVTSYDDPALSGVYKLVQATINEKEIATAKKSPGKPSYPGKKQIYRFLQSGYYSHDQICLFEERHPSAGLPLLHRYVRNGQMEQDLPPLDRVRQYALEELGRLPDPFHQISTVEDYPVLFSQALQTKLQGLE
jgi:nicotinate phosphoribosyltransferase